MHDIELRLGWPDSALLRIRERARLTPQTLGDQLFPMLDLAMAHASRDQRDSTEYYLRALLSATATAPGLQPNIREGATEAARAELLLMERFYTYWLGATPHTKAQALQHAQRDVRDRPQYAHPKFWAGFQLVGAD